MKGDQPTLQQIVEKYGDPIDALASMYFDCLLRADQYEAAGETQEAEVSRNMAEKCRKELAKYGFVPKMDDEMAKAERQ